MLTKTTSRVLPLKLAAEAAAPVVWDGKVFTAAIAARADEPAKTISRIDWQKNFLTISGPFPGEEIKINYLEAYCRPGSTDRDWGQTVIPHTAERIPTDDPRVIRLRDQLKDGVTVNRWLTTGFLAASATTNETAFATYKVVRSTGMLGFDNQARV